MKKLIGLLLSLAMVVSLSLGSVGCGGKDKEKKADKPADKTGTDVKEAAKEAKEAAKDMK